MGSKITNKNAAKTAMRWCRLRTGEEADLLTGNFTLVGVSHQLFEILRRHVRIESENDGFVFVEDLDDLRSS